MQHDWNFDDSYTVSEFMSHVGNVDKRYRTQMVNPHEGEPFPALAIPTNQKLSDGRTAFCFFALSASLAAECADEQELKSWLKEHKTSVRLLEPIDKIKYGLIYLEGNVLDTWED